MNNLESMDGMRHAIRVLRNALLDHLEGNDCDGGRMQTHTIDLSHICSRHPDQSKRYNNHLPQAYGHYCQDCRHWEAPHSADDAGRCTHQGRTLGNRKCELTTDMWEEKP